MKFIDYNREWATAIFNLIPGINTVAVDQDGSVFGYSSEDIKIVDNEWMVVRPLRSDQWTYLGKTDTTKVCWRSSIYRREPLSLCKLYPMDTLVYVWSNDESKKCLRYSTGTTDTLGRLICFNYGCTSKTAHQVSAWDNCSPSGM